jgi:hypothetical protein
MVHSAKSGVRSLPRCGARLWHEGHQTSRAPFPCHAVPHPTRVRTTRADLRWFEEPLGALQTFATRSPGVLLVGPTIDLEPADLLGRYHARPLTAPTSWVVTRTPCATLGLSAGSPRLMYAGTARIWRGVSVERPCVGLTRRTGFEALRHRRWAPTDAGIAALGSRRATIVATRSNSGLRTAGL